MSKLLLINSKNRINKTQDSSECYFLINEINVKKADVVALHMPMTHYNINSSNNVVYFNDGSNKSFTITPDNYTDITIVTALMAGFNAVSSGFTVTYSDTNMKLTISRSSNFSLTFATNTYNSAAYILGFNNNDTASSNNIVSDNCIDLSIPLFLHCIIGELGTNALSTDGTLSTFIFPNKVNSGDILFYGENTDYPQSSSFYDPNIQSLHIRFSFPDNVPCNINNNNWSMLLRLHQCGC